MPNFQLLANSPALTCGLVLRLEGESLRYLRLTHVFPSCVYTMWVDEPEGARYARRPRRMPIEQLLSLAESEGAGWGRIVLPPPLTTEPEEGSHKAALLESAWCLVRPLIKLFEREANLSRINFTSLVRQRADETESSQSTVLRTLLRFYYFGGTRLSLLPLPPGVRPGHGTSSGASRDLQVPPRRRGRQSALARELGRNEFVVRSEDIDDMVACVKRLLARGPAFQTTAHEQYLAQEFRIRHTDLFDRYVAGRLPEPVTARQFRYYINEHLKVSDELARNLRTHKAKPGFTGSVRASGPGEVYEIDATGGRLYLVSSDNPPTVLGKPIIYLLVDRWSRFVVSAYMSLRPASYEEVRHMLLIAFTSREARFSRLGINISDARWPVGRMPAIICPDRGSDFMSESMEQSVVTNLRIELTPLPPLCPDGKAIVERLIREIKRRIATSGIEGVYADRPLDPRSKKAARKAEAGAVRTLAEAYRLLVDIIVDHNNRPHQTLRRRRVLTQAGEKPTPQAAYLWGLRHITGLRSAPLTEDDYHRLLLSIDKASISNGVLRYKGRVYAADNEPAAELARNSTGRPRGVEIRLDKTLPTQIHVPNLRGPWARFRMMGGMATEIAGISLDEEEAMAGHTALLWARAEHEGRVARVAANSKKRRSTSASSGQGAVADAEKAPTPESAHAQLNRLELIAARNHETAKMKADLLARRSTSFSDADPQETSPATDWMRIEEEERRRSLDIIRKHRNGR